MQKLYVNVTVFSFLLIVLVGGTAGFSIPKPSFAKCIFGKWSRLEKVIVKHEKCSKWNRRTENREMNEMQIVYVFCVQCASFQINCFHTNQLKYFVQVFCVLFLQNVSIYLPFRFRRLVIRHSLSQTLPFQIFGSRMQCAVCSVHAVYSCDCLQSAQNAPTHHARHIYIYSKRLNTFVSFLWYIWHLFSNNIFGFRCEGEIKPHTQTTDFHRR